MSHKLIKVEGVQTPAMDTALGRVMQQTSDYFMALLDVEIRSGSLTGPLETWHFEAVVTHEQDGESNADDLRADG